MNALEAWAMALDKVAKEGIKFKDNEGRVCTELVHETIRFDPLGYDLLLKEMRRYERWSFPSLEDLKRIINHSSHQGLAFTLGSRLHAYRESIDQVNDYVIPLLKKDNNSRRALIVLYDPSHDSKPEQKTYPSLAVIFFKIVEKKLTVSAWIRSNDLLLGFPVSLVELGLLQKEVSTALGVDIGEIVVHSGSMHFYADNKDTVEDILKRWKK
ncbi:MAG: thymidylate synthase [Candidatus Woesearchaeota archaeon]